MRRFTFLPIGFLVLLVSGSSASALSVFEAYQFVGFAVDGPVDINIFEQFRRYSGY